MAKTFVIASVRANGTRWNVTVSDSKEAETFVGREGALGYLASSVATRAPVQALVYRAGTGGDEIEEAWFFENGTRRKLNVITLIVPDTKRGNW